MISPLFLCFFLLRALSRSRSLSLSRSLRLTGYNGGSVRLELVQEVGGVPTASVIVEGQKITFPYQLDITGAPGVSEGTLYLSEEVDGSYQELGHYPITFEKAE